MRGLLLGWIATLCVFGIARAAPPLSVYGSLPAFENAAISPSGKFVALVGTAANQRRLIIIDDQSKVVRQIAVGDIKVRDIAWGGEDRVLLWYGSTQFLGAGFIQDKLEITNVLVVPAMDEKPWGIFEGMESVAGGVRSSYGVIQRNGRWYGYFGGITLEAGTHQDAHYFVSGDPELYEVDLQSRATRRIAKRLPDNTTWYRHWGIDGAGQVAAMMDVNSESGEWRIMSAGGRSIAKGEDRLGRVEFMGEGSEPGTVLYATADASDVEHWFEQPLTGGPAKEILADEGVYRGIKDHRTRQLMGWVSEGDRREAHFFDPRQEKIMRGTERAFPGVTVELVDWNDAFDRLIVRTDGSGDPGTWWLVDIKTGNADELGSSYQVAPKDVGAIRMVAYKAADGTALEGVLTLPPGRAAKMLPAIVLPHGGPAARDYPEFDWWAQAFASRGYAVFQPNFRGSTGYGPKLERAGDGQWGRAMQTDISDGLADLVRQGLVDPKRVCIMGGSYGGYAALAGVTLQKGLYRCAVSVAGVSDLQDLAKREIHDSDQDQILSRQLDRQLGPFDALKAVSPIRLADHADAPILLIHGKDDTVVPYAQSVAMEKALKQQGKPVEFVTLPGEDHWLSRGATRLQMLTAADAFIERYNPPDANPAALAGR